MDSINRQQPEQNRRDLSGAGAIERVRDMTKDADTCFLATAASLGTIWFLSSIDSHKNQEIAIDPNVKLFFQVSKHSGFLELDGHADISQDKAQIKRLWNFMLRTWFTDGEDDPRITVIKVTPRSGYYWDNKHGDAVAGAKVAVGAVAGVTLDDSIEGRLTFG